MGIHAKPTVCEACPAFRIGKGFVPPTLVDGAELVLMGSGPSSDDYLDGAPFTGHGGRKLDYWLTSAGLDRTKLSLGHVVQCQLPYEKGSPREPKLAEYDYCRKAHWGSWLSKAPAKLVAPIGVGATKALVGRTMKARDIGNLHETGDGLFLPIQSPSYISGGNWAEEPAQVSYLKYAKDIVDEKAAPRPDFSKPPPGIQFIQSPSPADLDKWGVQLSSHTKPEIVCDIETAGDHLRLVGLFDIHSASYLGFPVRTIGGGIYWNSSDLPIAISWLYELLSDPAISKTFHNGQAFDVVVLERNGFAVAGYGFDTMLAVHVAYPGVPKGLEDLAKVHLRAGGWKALVKDESEGGEGK